MWQEDTEREALNKIWRATGVNHRGRRRGEAAPPLPSVTAGLVNGRALFSFLFLKPPCHGRKTQTVKMKSLERE